MSNMSYCRFENTSSDLQECIDALENGEYESLSDTEKQKADELREQAEEYMSLFDEKDKE